MQRASATTVEEMRGALPRTMQALQPFLHPLKLSVGLDRCTRPVSPR
jgi:3-deoxy-D-manno-octulosonic-acid transferase